MLRMNRQNTGSTKYIVKSNCANCDTGFKCLGVMISNTLQMKVDSKKVNKQCLVINGKDCDYYNKFILPIV